MDNFLLEDDDFLGRWVTWALWALAIIVCIATVTGQVESYNGLYIWFATHHVTGFWADFAPLTVDSFTVIGELAIFAGISRHWDWKSRVLPWCSAMIGIVSSVAANVGDKVQFHSIPTDLTGAIFPLAGAFGIVIGLGVLKRVAKDHKLKKAKQAAKPAENFFDGGGPWPAPVETVKERVHVGSAAWVQSPQIEATFEKPEVIPGPMVEQIATTVPVNRDQELKGLDVLIPPTRQEVPAFESVAPPTTEVPAWEAMPPQREEAFSWDGIVQPPTGPMPVTASTVEPVPVSREEARRRSLKFDRGLVTDTGSWSVIPPELS